MHATWTRGGIHDMQTRHGVQSVCIATLRNVLVTNTTMMARVVIAT